LKEIARRSSASPLNDIKGYAAVGEAAFLVDRMRQDAAIRKLEIIDDCLVRARWSVLHKPVPRPAHRLLLVAERNPRTFLDIA